MPLYDVVILTDSRYVNPSAPGQYVQNILTEDRLVQQSLEQKQLKVTRKDWADPGFDWSSAKAILFRTTWDYFDKFDAFKAWLTLVSAKTKLINSTEIILWNLDKSYLGELEKKGVRIIPTLYLRKGETRSLAELHDQSGWDETVLKPTVGGAGRHTFRLRKNALGVQETNFRKLIAEEDFMLQPFQKSITEKGEWSLVFFGDTFSHAVLKTARKGDFRVQDDFGGTVHDYQPSQKEIDFALKALAACPAKPAYARVDIVVDNNAELAVSELELIEPELWFRRNPEAADLLSEEILKRLT